MEFKPRDFVIYFSIKLKGDWDAIYETISKKEPINEEDVVNVLASNKYNVITILDEEYPLPLKQIHKPPFALFYRGDLSLLKDYKRIVAFVGSREPSKYAQEHLPKLVKDIALDHIIISGCAIGIDTLAHQSALAYKGKTIGVLGSGIDVAYPHSNLSLINEIAANHLLISEYPAGVQASPEQFIPRNRIIVGLSNSVIVFDVKKASGTQSTAYKTANENRNLLSIPYPLGTEYLNNELIKEGCHLIETGDDIRFLDEKF